MNLSLFINFIKYIYYGYENRNENGIINYFLFTNKNYLLRLLSCLFLEINSQQKLLSDITAIDWLTKEKRFVLVYNLLSLLYHYRIFVYFNIGDLEKVSSIISLYPSSSWYEREVWDLYGILFLGHGDLRRILTDYGFIGFPLRKDFPLSGHQEVYYDYVVESILYRDLKLIQVYRLFQKE